ncbi:MAG: sialidase family protein [Bryobacterales bacterium]|nr:sialidase family protein [Bryobacterales bacterium]
MHDVIAGAAMSRRSLLWVCTAAGIGATLPESGCAGKTAVEAGAEKTDLFTARTQGYELYRIPGIAVTPKGTVLAYAEARKTLRGDWGTIDIVLRRSEDGGKTWSPQTVIANVPGEKTKNPVALAQNLAEPSAVTYNNPTAIIDRKTGAVHFLFCLEYMRAFYMRSDDDGKSFSDPMEITPAFDEFRADYGWKVIATGPGHGIQLRSGRLIVPVWMSTGTGGHAHRPSVVSTIYSDDHGATWHRGEIAVPNTEDSVNPSETVAEQLSDGRVMLNVRTETKAHRRLIVTSTDGATGWSAPRFQEELKEPVCFGSIVRLSGAGDGRKSRLLFVNPDNLKKGESDGEPGKNRDRKNLTVQLSYDDGQTWTVKRVIEPGWSGYADINVGSDGSIYLLYERGGIGDNHFQTAALTLAKFDLEWLTKGDDKLEEGK